MAARHPARSSAQFAALFGVITLLLAGCGDDSASPAGGQTTPSTVPSLALPPESTATATATRTPMPERTATEAAAETTAGEDDLLRICVEVSPAAAGNFATADAADRVRDGLPEYARLYQLSSDAMEEAGAAAYPPLVTPRVEGGCPDGYLPPGDFTWVKPDPVTVSSPYHLHIFVVTEGEIADRLPAETRSLRMAYEMKGSGHEFAEVTTALYLPVTELAIAANTGWAMADAYGLTTILRYPCGRPDPKPECQGITPP